MQCSNQQTTQTNFVVLKIDIPKAFESLPSPNKVSRNNKKISFQKSQQNFRSKSPQYQGTLYRTQASNSPPLTQQNFFQNNHKSEKHEKQRKMDIYSNEQNNQAQFGDAFRPMTQINQRNALLQCSAQETRQQQLTINNTFNKTYSYQMKGEFSNLPNLNQGNSPDLVDNRNSNMAQTTNNNNWVLPNNKKQHQRLFFSPQSNYVRSTESQIGKTKIKDTIQDPLPEYKTEMFFFQTNQLLTSSEIKRTIPNIKAIPYLPQCSQVKIKESPRKSNEKRFATNNEKNQLIKTINEVSSVVSNDENNYDYSKYIQQLEKNLQDIGSNEKLVDEGRQKPTCTKEDHKERKKLGEENQQKKGDKLPNQVDQDEVEEEQEEEKDCLNDTSLSRFSNNSSRKIVDKKKQIQQHQKNLPYQKDLTLHTNSQQRSQQIGIGSDKNIQQLQNQQQSQQTIKGSSSLIPGAVPVKTMPKKRMSIAQFPNNQQIRNLFKKYNIDLENDNVLTNPAADDPAVNGQVTNAQYQPQQSQSIPSQNLGAKLLQRKNTIQQMQLILHQASEINPQLKHFQINQMSKQELHINIRRVSQILSSRKLSRLVDEIRSSIDSLKYLDHNSLIYIPQRVSARRLFVSEQEDEYDKLPYFLHKNPNLMELAFDEVKANQFLQQGLSISKELQAYSDQFEDDLNPKQWLHLCRETKNHFDARCPQFVNGQYQWCKVKVLDYSERQKKYKVKLLGSQQEGNSSSVEYNEEPIIKEEQEYIDEVCEPEEKEAERGRVEQSKKLNNQVKLVGRFSMIFFIEDLGDMIKKIEKLRLELAKAKDNHRFNAFVERQPSQRLVQLSEGIKKNIFEFVGGKLKTLDTMKFGKLIFEVEQQHLKQQKLFKVLYEMVVNPESFALMNELNVEDRFKLRRFIQPHIPKFGSLMSGINYLKLMQQELFEKQCLTLRKEGIEALHLYYQKAYYFGLQSILKTENLPTPIAIEDLISTLQKTTLKAQKELTINFQDYVLEQIIDGLERKFKNHGKKGAQQQQQQQEFQQQQNNKAVISSGKSRGRDLLEDNEDDSPFFYNSKFTKNEISRFLRRIELQQMMFIKDQIFQKTCDDWLGYLQSFRKFDPTQILNPKTSGRPRLGSGSSSEDEVSLASQQYQQQLLYQAVSDQECRLIPKKPMLIVQFLMKEIPELLEKDNDDNIFDEESSSESSPSFSKSESSDDDNNPNSLFQVKPNKQEVLFSLSKPLNFLCDIIKQLQNSHSSTASMSVKQSSGKKYIQKQSFMLQDIEETYKKNQIIENYLDEQWKSSISKLMQQFRKFSEELQLNTKKLIRKLFTKQVSKNYFKNKRSQRNIVGVPGGGSNSNNSSKRESTVTGIRDSFQGRQMINRNNVKNKTTMMIISQVGGVSGGNSGGNANISTLSSQRTQSLLSIDDIYVQQRVALLELDKQPIVDYLARMQQRLSSVVKLCNNQVLTPLFLIDTEKCKASMISRFEYLQSLVLKRVVALITSHIKRINTYYMNLEQNCERLPQNEEEFINLKRVFTNSDKDIQALTQEIRKINELIELVQDHYFPIGENVIEQYFYLFEWPKKVQQILGEAKKKIEVSEKNLKEKIRREVSEIRTEIKNIEQELEDLKGIDNVALARNFNVQTQILNDKIKETINKIASLNKRQEQFGMEITEYPSIRVTQIAARPYIKLWEICYEFQIDQNEWSINPIQKINFSQMEKKIENYYTETLTLIANFTVIFNEKQGQEGKAAIKAATHLKSQIEELQDKIWVIQCLTVDAMVKRPVNMQNLFQECHFPIQELNDDLNLKTLMELGVVQHKSMVEDISRTAEKQLQMEKKLQEMYDKLKELRLEIQPHKQTNSFIVKNFIELQDQLGDQLTLVIMMKTSPYIKPFIRRAQDIEYRILSCQDALEEWLKCQRSWVYLEAIFTGDDIRKKMQTEALRFRDIDQNWRKIMTLFIDNPVVFDMDADRIKGDFERFNVHLNNIQKALAQYLETKRVAFPRFYFISDEDLLDILARSKDPESFQRHLSKCFEAISSVELLKSPENSKQLTLLAMLSNEKERVAFTKQVLLDTDLAVEQWMIDIEQIMRNTLRHYLNQAFHDKAQLIAIALSNKPRSSTTAYIANQKAELSSNNGVGQPQLIIKSPVVDVGGEGSRGGHQEQSPLTKEQSPQVKGQSQQMKDQNQLMKGQSQQTKGYNLQIKGQSPLGKGGLLTATKGVVNHLTSQQMSEWIFKWPGQIAILVQEIDCTSKIEMAIRNSKKNGVQNCIEEMSADLQTMATITQGESSDLHRATLSSMIIHQVHARDVADQILRSGATDVNDFQWQSNKRYYYNLSNAEQESSTATETAGTMPSLATANGTGVGNVSTTNNSLLSQANQLHIKTQQQQQLKLIFQQQQQQLQAQEKQHQNQSSKKAQLQQAQFQQHQLAILEIQQQYALRSNSQVSVAQICIMSHKVGYGFEYLGNTTRLVVTPLTDKCYRTLFCAYQFNYGGAPEGPAGTGKTETVKDLAKATGIQCVVFNASDGLNYMAMFKFFVGLASSGAWCCFDEFNRIDPEVLSVVAQQIMAIQTAIREQRQIFLFEGVTVALVQTCTINITMNPGYAGRSELPETLKALFRPCTMMVADYEMIAEIYLYSLGFQLSRQLAKKIVTCFRLSQSQVSMQDHYDFGMRSLKAVLMSAGKIKRKNMQVQDKSEELIAYEALLYMNMPKFTSEDLILFLGITSDLFPDIKRSSLGEVLDMRQCQQGGVLSGGPSGGQSGIGSSTSLGMGMGRKSTELPRSSRFLQITTNSLTKIEEEGKEQHQPDSIIEAQKCQLQQEQSDENQSGQHIEDQEKDLFSIEFDRCFGGVAEEGFNKKCKQLFETIQVRHGIIVVGEPSSGKSTLLEQVSKTISNLATKQTILNPEAYYRKILYGTMDLNTKTWNDGVLAILIRNYLEMNIDKGNAADFAWITFDGPVDAQWIENMNTVLDDNKKLCLNSGEIIKLTPFIITFFECENLIYACPSTVSRCGIIYTECEQLGWKTLVRSFLRRDHMAELEKQSPQVKTQLQIFVFELLEAVLHFMDGVNRNSDCALPLSNIILVDSFLSILELNIKVVVDHYQKQADRELGDMASTGYNPYKTMAEEPNQLSNAAIFAAIWGIGGLLEEKSRKQFSNYFTELFLITQKDGGGVNGGSNISSSNSLQITGKVGSGGGSTDFRVGRKISIPSNKGGVSGFPTPWTQQLWVGNLTQDFTQALQSESGYVFDLCFNLMQWTNWVPREVRHRMRRKSDPTDFGKQGNDFLGRDQQVMIVKTPETIRLSFFLNFHLSKGHSFLATGPTGTGKTVTLLSELAKITLKNEPQSIYQVISFSGNTKATTLQKIIECKMTTKYRKGIYRPEERKDQLIVFADDFSMPFKEKQGAQPPLELIRQWFDTQGWYDLENKEFKQLQGLVYLAAMMPRAAASLPTLRVLRHFAILYIEPFETDSLLHIFNTYMMRHYAMQQFSQDVLVTQQHIMAVTINLYHRIKNTSELLPTPKKAHYIINLRDIQRICDGLTLANPKRIRSALEMKKLWFHECQRVFGDRLIDSTDNSIFIDIVLDVLQEQYGSVTQAELEPKPPLQFTSLIEKLRNDEQETFYSEVVSKTELISAIQDILSIYNRSANNSSAKTDIAGGASKEGANSLGGKMNLVIFQEAAHQIVKIVRIIQFKQGHALLVGPGGSGRTAMTRLSTFAAGMNFLAVEIGEEWKEQIKRVMNSAGVDNRKSVFYVKDSQIDDIMMENIAQIINNGEISDMFTKDEKAKYIEEMDNALLRLKLANTDKATGGESVGMGGQPSNEGSQSLAEPLGGGGGNQSATTTTNSSKISQIIDQTSEQMKKKLNVNTVQGKKEVVAQQKIQPTTLTTPSQEEQAKLKLQQQNNIEASQLKQQQPPPQSQDANEIMMADNIQTKSINARFEKFTNQFKRNVRIVLSLSPLGSTFRQKIRTYPSLVNCMTINWLMPWPEEAFTETATALFKLNDLLLNESLTQTHTQGQGQMQTQEQTHGTAVVQLEQNRLHLIRALVNIHRVFRSLAENVLTELRQKVHITPLIFIQFIGQINEFIEKFQRDNITQIERYKRGIDKIIQTEKEISILRENLFMLQTKLAISSQANTEILQNLTIKQQEADQKKLVCEQEEKNTTRQREEADILQQECKVELSRVLPLLKQAVEALQKVTKEDLTLLRSYTSPPEPVRVVVEAICFIFGVNEEIKFQPMPHGQGGGDNSGDIKKSQHPQMYQNFWEYSKKYLLNERLLKQVRDFKEDKISSIKPANIVHLAELIENPLFEVKKVFQASEPAGNFSLWIRAVKETYDALLVVNPKKEKLKQAEITFKNMTELLKIKKEALKEALAVLQVLQVEYEKARLEKEALEEKIRDCTIKLTRAEKLILGLASEKRSWIVKQQSCEAGKRCILSDALICAQAVLYNGAFTSFYREKACYYIQTDIIPLQAHIYSRQQDQLQRQQTRASQSLLLKAKSLQSQNSLQSQPQSPQHTSQPVDSLLHLEKAVHEMVIEEEDLELENLADQAQKLEAQQHQQAQQTSLIQEKLSDPITTGIWVSKFKLPNDNYSIDNIVMMKNSNKFPLFIDPQQQANIFIKELERDNHLLIINPSVSAGSGSVFASNTSSTSTQQNAQTASPAQNSGGGNLKSELLKVLENALELGYPVLIEGMQETVNPPMLEPIVYKNFKRANNTQKVQLGEKVIEVSSDFQLYMTCKMSSPEFGPELSSKTQLLNFIITEQGLEDQMMNIIVKIEEPEKEKKRLQNIQEIFENKQSIERTEKHILQLISNAKGDDLLNDEELINALEASKHESEYIQQRIVLLNEDQNSLNQTRLFYKDISRLVSNLFFIFIEITSVDHMYQFSYNWFMHLFEKAIRTALRTEYQERCKNIFERFLSLLYANVCRSLKEADKLLISFLICCKIMMVNKKISMQELRFFSLGGVSPQASRPNPKPTWLTSKQWAGLNDLATELPHIFGPEFISTFENKIDQFEALFKEDDGQVNPSNHNNQNFNQIQLQQQQQIAAQVQKGSNMNLGGSSQISPTSLKKYHLLNSVSQQNVAYRLIYQDTMTHSQLLKNMTEFQRMILLRILRPNMVQQAVQSLVRKEIGEEFVQTPPLDLDACFADSTCQMPIIFILSPGTDPREQIINFSVKKEMSNQFVIISLGQGQTEKAKAAITEGMRLGQWILLQNCHLAPSFMPVLERIVEGLNPAKQEFRLWLTTYPTTNFPITVLQKSLKIRTEAPKGLKNMLRRAYGVLDLDPKFKKMHERFEHSWQRIFFSVCFFHAVVQERKKFGPIGWKQPYEFNFSDLAISFYQISTILESSSDITHLPWDYITYLISETNYGGRVTDKHDQRTLSILSKLYLNKDTLSHRFTLMGTGEHYKVPLNSLQSAFWNDHLSIINNYPQDDFSYIFGMHENSAIVEQIFCGQILLDTLLQVLPKAGSSSSASSAQSSQVSSPSSKDELQKDKQQPQKPPAASNQASGKDIENQIISICRQIMSKLPLQPFDLKKLPNDYMNSMNIVLLQESKRYNKLIELVYTSCASVISAFEGLTILDEIIEEISTKIFDNIVPIVWKKAAYPSTKPLGSWINNLVERVTYLQEWINSGQQPSCFWISSFFLTTSFLTGVMQNYARVSKISVDSIKFSYQVLPQLQSQVEAGDYNQIPAPSIGCYIYGLFLDGAKWNYQNNHLADPDKGVLFSKMPIIWLIPTEQESKLTANATNQMVQQVDQKAKQNLPIKHFTSKRAIEISLSGISSNWIIDIDLPLSGLESEQANKWALQGVALLTQLDY